MSLSEDEGNQTDSTQSEISERSSTGSDSSLNSTDEDAFKLALQDCLDDVKAAGSFAAQFHSSLYPNPGLYIKGIGLVGLPLSTKDAKAIIRCSKQAPFGRGDETVVDISVRRTWELDTSKFEIRNPAWVEYLSDLKSKAIDALGVSASPSDIRAEPYKLLLYEKDAFFKAHRDTEKVPGMFGTLVVCLPSKHNGGEVHLSHSGEKKVFDTSTTSEFDLSTLAWYSDVKHEIKAVTSGYRLVLTYNLVSTISNGLLLSAGQADEGRLQLQKILRKWCRDFTHLEKFAYIFDHQYTESSLSIENLKGQDKAKGSLLDDVCDSNGVYLFLGSLTRVVVEEDEDDEGDASTTLDVFTPSGLQIAKSLYIPDAEILLEDPFDRDADSEDEGEYTGNENAPGELRYHNTVALLVPKENISFVFGSFLQHSECTAHLLDFLCQDVLECPDDAVIRENAIKAIETYLSKEPSINFRIYPNTKFDRPVMRVILKWTMEFEARELFTKAVHHCMKSMEDGNGFDPEMISAITSCFKGDNSEFVPDWEGWFGLACSKISKISDLQDFLFRFPPTLDDHLKASFKEWSLKKLDEKLSSQASIDIGDETALLNILSLFDGEWFLSIFVPLLRERATRDVVAPFLNILFKRRERLYGTEVITSAFHILKDVAPRFIPIPGLRKSQPLESNCYYYSTDINNLPTEFTTLMETCLDVGCTEEVRSVLSVVSNDFVELQDLSNVNWSAAIKAVRPLQQKLHEYSDSIPSSEVRTFIISLLESYIHSVLNQKPPEPVDWKFAPRGCSPTCKDCALLDAFLTDSTQKVERFTMAQPRRNHLSSRFYGVKSLKEETITNKSPYTLVVTKITKTDTEYTRQKAQWQGTYGEMRKNLKDLQSESLKELLGERYQDLILDTAVNNPSGTSGPSSAPPVTLSTSNSNRGRPKKKAPVTGKKRKAKHIDLTED